MCKRLEAFPCRSVAGVLLRQWRLRSAVAGLTKESWGVHCKGAIFEVNESATLRASLRKDLI